MYDSEIEKIREIINAAQKIVIVQADNPDADSLGSALALESVLGELGKEPYLYCGVDIPSYLQYLAGWDRVQKDLPNQFDASIIVDASTLTLLEKLQDSGQQGWIASKPCIVLDHHATVDNPILFATVSIIDAKRSSAGELIMRTCQQLEWAMPVAAQAFIMTSILGDTQGLSNQLTSAETYRVMAELTDNGVDRPKLEELRRAATKMPVSIVHYKGELLKRAEFSYDNTIVCVTIPQNEITEFSPLYNPGPLVQADLLQTQGVLVAIVFKHYADGKVTGAIRCNAGAAIAADLASSLGGGGHDYASGFKITDGRPFNELKSECLQRAHELLAALHTKEDDSDETVQYAYSTN
jgi:phosphoesterase RecJ-like protein